MGRKEEEVSCPWSGRDMCVMLSPQGPLWVAWKQADGQGFGHCAAQGQQEVHVSFVKKKL